MSPRLGCDYSTACSACCGVHVHWSLFPLASPRFYRVHHIYNNRYYEVDHVEGRTQTGDIVKRLEPQTTDLYTALKQTIQKEERGKVAIVAISVNCVARL